MTLSQILAQRMLSNAVLYLADTYGVRDPIKAMQPDKWPIRQAAKLLCCVEELVTHGKPEIEMTFEQCKQYDSEFNFRGPQ